MVHSSKRSMVHISRDNHPEFCLLWFSFIFSWVLMAKAMSRLVQSSRTHCIWNPQNLFRMFRQRTRAGQRGVALSLNRELNLTLMWNLNCQDVRGRCHSNPICNNLCVKIPMHTISMNQHIWPNMKIKMLQTNVSCILTINLISGRGF